MQNQEILKRLTILSIILAGAVWSAGCAQPPASRARPRIALIMKSLANEFFQTMENGAKKHQQENASEYELIANGIKDELDVSRQIDLVEQMIAQRVAAIVIAPADSKALVTVCKRALDAGIPVVNIDNRFDTAVVAEKGVKIPFVGPDNRKGARLAGEYLAGRLKPGDQVAIIEGAPNAFNGVQRRLGFEEAMKSGKIQIVSSQTGAWETSRAHQVASSVMTEYPELKAFLCANDNMALGAVAAIRAAGKSKNVLVIGFDNISAVQQLIKDGQMLATVDQHGDRLAVYGIEYALKIIKDQSTPEDRETPVDLITAETLK
jgi:ribose transport system substrate-binding protein